MIIFYSNEKGAKDHLQFTTVRTVDRNAILPYSAQAMYQLVADVETYPDFLPWCRSTHTRQTGDNEVEATLEIARGPVRKTFTTRNQMHEGSSISMSLVDGPFRHLQGKWSFTPLGEDGSKVELHLEFDFASKLLHSTVGPVFGHIAETMVNAFCKRAHEIYGQRRDD